MAFCVVPTLFFGPQHLPDEDARSGLLTEIILLAAQLLWRESACQDGSFPVTHDVYLKLYQLSRPDLSRLWQALLFDEVQDAKPLTETVPMLKPLQLFNAEQCEGLPTEVAASLEKPPTVDEDGILSPDVMDRVIRMFNATGVKHPDAASSRAYYRPLTDKIVMPVAEQFFTEADC